MARLRTLLVTGPDGPRDILILDGLTAEQIEAVRAGTIGTDDTPPVIATEFPIDLPEDGDTETSSEEMTRLFRKMMRQEAPGLMRTIRDTPGLTTVPLGR